MSVHEVEQRFQEREASYGPEGYKFVETYWVRCTDINDGPWTALLDPRIPRYDDPHPQLHWAAVRNVTVTPFEREPMLFLVVVVYTSKTGGGSDGEVENPLERRSRMRFIETMRMEEYTHDVEGTKIVDITGTPYDPALQRQVTDGTLIVEWNVKGIDASSLEYSRDTVNKDDFWIANRFRIRPLWAKMGRRTLEDIDEAGIRYARIRLELFLRKPIEINEPVQPGQLPSTKIISAWDQRRDQYSFMYTYREPGSKLTDPGVAQPIYLPNYKPDGSINMPPQTQPQRPVALDKYGRYEYPDPENPKKMIRVTDAHSIWYKPYPKRNFGEWEWPTT